MNDILKMINDEQAKIAFELNFENSRAQFYHQFNGSTYSSLDEVLNLDQELLATVLILSDDNDLQLSEVRSALSGAIAFLGFCDDIDKSVSIFESLDELLIIGAYDMAIDVFNGTKKIHFIDSFKESSLKIKAFEELLLLRGIIPSDFVYFMKLYRKCPDKVFSTFSLIGSFRQAYAEKESHHENIQFFEDVLGVKIKSKKKNKYVNSQISNKWRIDGMMAIVRNAFNYGNKLINQDNSRRRTLIRQSRLYDELKTKLSEIDDSEIVNVKNFITKIPSEEIKLEILKFIYKHNMELYKNIEKEYHDLSNNDVYHYKLLLSKYGLSLNDDDLKIIMSKSLEELEDILGLLRSMGIKDLEYIVSVLKITSLDTISRLNSLFQVSVLSSNTLKNNLSLFDSESSLYLTLNRNVSLLEEKGINLKLFKDSNALFFPCDLFSKNIETLDSYSLLPSFNKTSSFEFLKSHTLDCYIDILLELGYESYLTQDLDILNYKSRFNRLRLLKELNIPIGSKKELIDVVSSDKFYVSDQNIDSYLYNACLYNMPNVSRLSTKRDSSDLKLDKFLISPRLYSFDGVLISKNRVMRNSMFVDSNCSLNDKVLYCILYGSVLNDLDIASIKKCLGIDYNDSIVLRK